MLWEHTLVKCTFSGFNCFHICHKNKGHNILFVFGKNVGNLKIDVVFMFLKISHFLKHTLMKCDGYILKWV